MVGSAWFTLFTGHDCSCLVRDKTERNVTACEDLKEKKGDRCCHGDLHCSLFSVKVCFAMVFLGES